MITKNSMKGETDMASTKNVETIIAAENQSEANEVVSFLNELAPVEKKDFLTFVQGIRFARTAMGASDKKLSTQNV